jgi:Zn-dependent peptidase ImmA (M78 family)
VNRANLCASAALAAERAIRALKITTLPVDPMAIAESTGISVFAKPAETAGASGMLIRQGNEFAIAYATHIQSQGFQRFSVAHELGHLQLPGHIDAVVDSQGIHSSFAGFESKDVYELEADCFAASFLMPRQLFYPALETAGEGLSAIESLSSTCMTSLHATAIRFTQCSRDAVAIVVSKGKQIEHCFMSESLKTFKGIDWLKKKDFLPADSETFRFNQDPANTKDAVRVVGSSKFQDWFGGNHKFEVMEEVLGLGSYGKTLTVLSGFELPEEESQLKESELIDSWTPKFRK